MRAHFWNRSAAFMAIAAMAACGGGDGGGSDDAPAGGGDEAPAVAVDPSTVGTISGMANFAGMVPDMEAIDMSAEAECAAGYGADGPTAQNVLVSDGGLANVFVYLSEGVTMAPTSSGGAAMLDQVNCRYTPHVLGVQSGQDIEITNSDNLLHNINATPTENRGFNISQPRAGITSTQSFAVAEVMVPVRCDVHGWMQAYIGVVDHPYFAVTGADGSFSIGNVPAGDYTMTAWHEEFGTMTASVTVAAGETAMASFDYSAEMSGADVPMGDALVIGHGTQRIRVERAQQ